MDRPIAKRQLFDHRPLQLNEDDYQRVCAIPKKKVYFIFLAQAFLHFTFSLPK